MGFVGATRRGGFVELTAEKQTEVTACTLGTNLKLSPVIQLCRADRPNSRGGSCGGCQVTGTSAGMTDEHKYVVHNGWGSEPEQGGPRAGQC